MTEEQKAEIREKMSRIFSEGDFVITANGKQNRFVPSDNPDYYCVDYVTDLATGETQVIYWRYDEYLL